METRSMKKRIGPLHRGRSPGHNWSWRWVSQHAKRQRNTRPKDCNKPPWQIRLEKDIEKLRADCGRLTQYINNNRSRKLIRHVKVIFETRNTHSKHENSNTKPEEF
ncbi:unnamed protein product [Euphydryas editha]|uniref:Uncharacterized protein n=1 Tax=Euphydryas editha TaxID=104508 RepID=A0AAU9TQ89_EUPED|nr:unnamed protein product [Euphydryas editha]